MTRTVHRRKFLKDGATATLGLALLPFPRIWGAKACPVVTVALPVCQGFGAWCLLPDGTTISQYEFATIRLYHLKMPLPLRSLSSCRGGRVGPPPQD